MAIDQAVKKVTKESKGPIDNNSPIFAAEQIPGDAAPGSWLCFEFKETDGDSDALLGAGAGDLPASSSSSIIATEKSARYISWSLGVAHGVELPSVI